MTMLRDVLLMLLLAASFMLAWTLVGLLPAVAKRDQR